MHLTLIRALLGLLLMLFSLSMLTPLLFAFIYNEQTVSVFLKAFCITIVTGAVLWLPNRKPNGQMQARDGFLLTSLFWIVLGLFGALPLYFYSALNLSVIDAVFESVSGLTTTGATLITGLDSLPKSILFYRQQLQWLGGVGIIVIAIAILPMLGIGGMQLYRAETPGPMKDKKLAPRVASTAKILFVIYVSMTVLCGLCYWLAGMTPFDALSHSFSTIAIGGFSTHDASIGHFDSPVILIIASFFMLLAGVNFALHFFAFQKRELSVYLRDTEAMAFVWGVITASILVVLGMSLYQRIDPMLNHSLKTDWVHDVFQVISFATTTGFTSTDYSHWPKAVTVLLLLLAFIGACAGSTGGGMKVIRILLLFKQGYREILRLVHPHAVIPIKLGGKPVTDRVFNAVWSFFAIYTIVFLILFLLVLATGVNFETSFSAVAACINNLGPGLGDVTYHYGNIPSTAKGLLCLAMLIGRLEVFTLLVLLTPAFWKK